MYKFEETVQSVCRVCITECCVHAHTFQPPLHRRQRYELSGAAEEPLQVLPAWINAMLILLHRESDEPLAPGNARVKSVREGCRS